MFFRTITVRVAVLYLACTTSLATAAPDDTPQAATAKLIGTWDATPALDEDVLPGDPNQDLPYVRASAVGVRVVYVFNRDGTMKIVTISRSGPRNGVTVDRLVPKPVDARWSVVRGDGDKGVTLRITKPDGAKILEQPLVFDNSDMFSANVYALAHEVFRAPFLFRRNVGDRAILWVRDNNRGGPNASLVKDMAGEIGGYVNKAEDFRVRLGAGVTKSGKATELHGFSEQLFVRELTSAEAQQVKLAPTDVSAMHWSRHRVYPVLSEARVSDGPEFDARGGRFDLRKPITGTVAFETINTTPPGSYAARFTFLMDETMVQLFQPMMKESRGGGKLKFTLKMPEKHAAYAGPIVVLVDLCRETKYENGEFTQEVLSQAVEKRFDGAAPAPADR